MKRLLMLASIFILAGMIDTNANAKEDNTVSEKNYDQSAGSEYAFMAKTREEAQSIADYYNATLVSYQYGVGSLYIENTDAAKAIDMAIQNGESADMPQLYPEIIYELDTSYEDSFIIDQWHLDSLNMDKVWDYSQGENVVVAVIDTGIDTDHEDLKDSIYNAISAIPEEEYGSTLEEKYKGPDDYFGHGTHVAGIIAAADNNNGCLGIAPKSKIMSIKSLERVGKTGTGKTSWVVAGINAAVEADVDIINMSIGGTSVKDELLGEAVKKAVNNGILVVCAAGNISNGKAKVFYPAAYDEVVSVAALKRSGESMVVDTSFSNFGSFVDIAAPGTSIRSTVPDGYGAKSGTSMACPIVSGAAALLLSKKADLTNEQICELMYDTAVDMGDSGKDDYYGNGMLDLIGMLEAYMEIYEPVLPESEVPDGEYIGAGYRVKAHIDKEGANIVYTIDGTDPDKTSAQYTQEGIMLAPDDLAEQKNITLKLRAIYESGRMSSVVTLNYTMVPRCVNVIEKDVTLDTQVIPKYGYNIDNVLKVPSNRYKFTVMPNETLEITIKSDEFKPKLVLYDGDNENAAQLKLKKSGEKYTWTNDNEAQMAVWLAITDETFTDPQNINMTKSLKYSIKWSLIDNSVTESEEESSGTQESESESAETEESSDTQTPSQEDSETEKSSVEESKVEKSEVEKSQIEESKVQESATENSSSDNKSTSKNSSIYKNTIEEESAIIQTECKDDWLYVMEEETAEVESCDSDDAEGESVEKTESVVENAPHTETICGENTEDTPQKNDVTVGEADADTSEANNKSEAQTLQKSKMWMVATIVILLIAVSAVVAYKKVSQKTEDEK